MVVLVASEGQAHALDGVGNKTGGAVAFGIRGGKRLQHRFDVVAAQIGHQRRQLIVGQRIDNGAQRVRPPQIGEQGGAPGLAALEGEGGIQAVRAVIDPGA